MAKRTRASKAASLMGRRSADARRKAWGEAVFRRRMRAWGKLGGRPKGSGKKHSEERRQVMAVYKQTKSKYWWYKFTWNGEPIRESTKQTNKRVAEQMEAAHRTALAKGEVGIRDKKPVPTLKDFAERDFLPFVRSTFAAKVKDAELLRERRKPAARVRTACR